MGLWDWQVESLHALGVRFSALELRTLEEPPEGMKVLHLHPLWDPRTPDGQIYFMQDEHGQTVWKPEIITLLSPYETEKHGYGVSSTIHHLWEVMETNWGSVSAAYPSYFGTVDGADVYDDNLEFVRREEPHPYPFWTCLPLDGQMEIEAAIRLSRASNSRLDDSLYSQLTFICDVEARSEFCVTADFEWLLVNDPKKARRMYGDAVDWEKAQEWADEAWSEYADPENMKAVLVQAYQDLLDGGVILDPRLGREAIQTHGLGEQPYRFNPIENYLDSGDFLALEMWRSIRSRTEFMHHRMSELRGSRELHVMQSLEGNDG